MAGKDNKTGPIFAVDNTTVQEVIKPTTTILRTQRVTTAATEEDFSPASLKKLSDVRRGQIHSEHNKGLS